MSPRYAKLTVIFERRDDGGLRAYCDDVPGFVLSHSNWDAVLEDVQPALEVILSAMLQAEVTVSPLHGIRDELEDAGVIAPVHSEREAREYVSHFAYVS